MDLKSRVIRLRLIVVGAAVSAIALLIGVISPAIFGSTRAFAAARAQTMQLQENLTQEAMKNVDPSSTSGPPMVDLPASKVPWQSLLSTANPGPANPMLSAVDCFLVAGLIAVLLGALLILMSRPLWRQILWPIVAFGSMSLTWYCLHLLVIGKATPLGFITTGSVLSYGLFVVAALILSVLWRRFFTRGPLEWVQHAAVTALTSPPARSPRDGRTTE